ncbi:MAG: hypothetical protein WC659_01840 [Patescibacteria group bacterium]
MFATFFLAPSRFLWDHGGMARPLTLTKNLKDRVTARVLARQCSICGCAVSIRLSANRSYLGGHYFGKVPKISKAEFQRAKKAGHKTERIGNFTLRVLNQDPKPYGCFEYWECESCYNENNSPPSPKNL